MRVAQSKMQQRQTVWRLNRAKLAPNVDPHDPAAIAPHGAVKADPSQLSHNRPCNSLPRFYVDQLVVCCKCGAEELWHAERQKWWYEVAKADINAQALYCRTCRQQERARKSEARRIHLEGLAKKQSRDLG